MAIKTFGLTHVALAVRDARRAAKFYQQVLGAVVVYKGDGFVQIQTPGTRDVMVFEERDASKGNEIHPSLVIAFSVARGEYFPKRFQR